MARSSCYSEIEEVLKGIARAYGELPTSASWHRDLLDLMAKPTAERSAVISDALKTDLEDHLAFRHFSRNATFPDVDWMKLAPLVHGLGSVTDRFVHEVRTFLTGIP